MRENRENRADIRVWAGVSRCIANAPSPHKEMLEHIAQKLWASLSVKAQRQQKRLAKWYAYKGHDDLT